jgi:DNA-binding NarL/FixJ family response regulator
MERRDTPPRVRVVLAEDHPAVAAALHGVLEPACEVLAIVGDGDALVAAVDRLTPEVIVTDISMPGCDGLAAAGTILRQHPQARIVLVTAHPEAALVQRGLATGALGYVLKYTAGEDLLPAVCAARRGQQYVSPCLGGGEKGMAPPGPSGVPEPA